MADTCRDLRRQLLREYLYKCVVLHLAIPFPHRLNPPWPPKADKKKRMALKRPLRLTPWRRRGSVFTVDRYERRLMFMIIRIKSSIQPQSSLQRWHGQGGFIYLLLAVVVFVLGLFISFLLIKTINESRPTSILSPYRPIEVCMLAVFSLALYGFRSYSRKYYGIIECAFGTVVGWNAFSMIDTSGMGKWAYVLAAAYIIVRGLDNISIGRKSETPQTDNLLIPDKSPNPLDTNKPTNSSESICSH